MAYRDFRSTCVFVVFCCLGLGCLQAAQQQPAKEETLAVPDNRDLHQQLSEKIRAKIPPEQGACVRSVTDQVVQFLEERQNANTNKKKASNISCRDNVDGYNFAHYALETGDMKLFQALKRISLLPKNFWTKRDKHHWTPLHYGAYYNRATMVRELLSMVSVVNPLTKQRMTPLHLAAHQGANDTLRVFMAYAKNSPLTKLKKGEKDNFGYVARDYYMRVKQNKEDDIASFLKPKVSNKGKSKRRGTKKDNESAFQQSQEAYGGDNPGSNNRRSDGDQNASSPSPGPVDIRDSSQGSEEETPETSAEVILSAPDVVGSSRSSSSEEAGQCLVHGDEATSAKPKPTEQVSREQTPSFNSDQQENVTHQMSGNKDIARPSTTGGNTPEFTSRKGSFLGTSMEVKILIVLISFVSVVLIGWIFWGDRGKEVKRSFFFDWKV